jgi:prevent-host-death family protein
MSTMELEMDAGIRELRDNLSRYLERVKAGAELTVTEHGRPIARITPIREESRYDALVREGLITPAPVRERSLPPTRVRPSGSVSELVREQRG